MKKKICVGFDYKKDYERVGNLGKFIRIPEMKDVIHFDAWLKHNQSEENMKAWIDEYVKDTSVTILLIGEETSNHSYISYMVKESLKNGNGILGIRIHNVKDNQGFGCNRGTNPLEYHYVLVGERHRKASNYYKTYTWSASKSKYHLENWINEAKQLSLNR